MVNKPIFLPFTRQSIAAFENAPEAKYDHLVTFLAQICGVNNLAKAANAILRTCIESQNEFALNVTISRREAGQLLLKPTRFMNACHAALRRHTRIFGPYGKVHRIYSSVKSQ